MKPHSLFKDKDSNGPRTVTAEYSGSDFDAAIAQAREQFGEQVSVICVPTCLRPMLIKKQGENMRKIIRDINGEPVELLDKGGVLHLLAYSAFQQFEKSPRRRGRIAMNVLFSRAIDRGYRDKERFEQQFRGARRNEKLEAALIDGLCEYVAVEDIGAAFTYMIADGGR